MAELRVRRVGYALGAAVTGIDLKQPVDDATLAEIKRAWFEHLILYFPGQNLSKAEFLTFVKRFGPLESVVKGNEDPEAAEMQLLHEKPRSGKPWRGIKNGDQWHSDKSFTTQPTAGAYVLCREIPEAGGDTMLANQYMAYDTLSATMKSVIDGLSAVHEYPLGVTRVANGASGPLSFNMPADGQGPAERPATVQPVVRVHPETKRKALYLGSCVRRFIGMTEEESRPLLDYLNAHATRYEFCYRHRWTVNDLGMWDNRCLLHIALSDYDLHNDPRLMFRSAVAGQKSGIHYVAGDDAAMERTLETAAASAG